MPPIRATKPRASRRLAANVTAATPLSSAGITLNDFTLHSTETQFQNQVNGAGEIRHRR